jgi:hypothetical protein
VSGTAATSCESSPPPAWLELHDGTGQDRREKQVRLTAAGRAELQRLRELLASLDTGEPSAQSA